MSAHRADMSLRCHNSQDRSQVTVAVTVEDGVIDELWYGKPHQAEGALRPD